MAQPLPDPVWSTSTEVCIACGYSLSGLAPPGVCPECGAPFEAEQLILAGVPQTNRAVSPWRRAAWVVVVVGGAFAFQVGILLLAVSWILTVVYLATLIGLLVWLLVSGPRERRGVERFVLSPAGIACLPMTQGTGAGRFDSAFTAWTGRESIELKRISAMWRRLRIGRRYGAGSKLIEVSFDSGLRCPDAAADRVAATIRRYIAQRAGAPAGALASPPTVPTEPASK